MTEEDDGVPLQGTSPPAPIESEEVPNELLKHDHHSEDQSEDENEDEPSSKQNQSPPSSPPLLEFPPVSTLPPTPPLPSSPTDLDMEEQDSEEDGPPPGWDNSYQLKEQAEQLSTPAATSVISSDIKTDDVQEDVRNEDGSQPQSQSHASPATELARSELTCTSSDLNMEQQESEDEGPPPGWDNKYQLKEQVEQLVTPVAVSAISSDINTEDVKQDAWNEIQPQSSDLNMEEQDSEDEGPPPGWDNKYQLKEQAERIPFSSDIKMENLRQDARNEEVQPRSHAQELVSSDIKTDQQGSEDEGPPPGWDSKCHPEPELQTTCSTTPGSDIKTEVVQEDVRNEDGPQPQSQPHASPAPELVPSAEEQDSEHEGPPPGWDSKSQPEPKLQTSHPTTTLLDIKMEDAQQHARNEDGFQPRSQSHPSPAPELIPFDIKVEEQDSEDDGPPPGWDSKCQPGTEPGPEPKLLLTHPTTSPSVQKDVKIVEEIPQRPTRQLSFLPTKRQISVPKPPTTIDYPEMGQMVCGSCRHLLSYPRGVRYVECACCLEENYVLEEHEVGQVICGGCNVLLMYPYGAPKVRCANCRMETEIGDQNRRPPLSEHQSRTRRHLKHVHAG